jgi:DNA-binding IclR family transcriptional regulator
MTDNLLIKAIENSTQYTIKVRHLLKLFAQVNINNSLTITTSELLTLSRRSRGVLFKSLRLLKEEGVISQEKRTYHLNSAKLKDLQSLYLAKQEFMKSNPKKVAV